MGNLYSTEAKECKLIFTCKSTLDFAHVIFHEPIIFIQLTYISPSLQTSPDDSGLFF